MDTYKCNYHMHSNYSDGSLSPAQLVRKFVDEEYDIIALTDHDSIEGVKEFMAACEAVKIKGVTGIEFSTSHRLNGKDYEICLLGYNIDPDNELMVNTCKELRAGEKKLSAEEAISLILQAGGQPFVAHPGMIREIDGRGSEGFWQESEKLIRDLKLKGLKGMECIYPDHTDEEEFRFIQLAGKYHLHVVSGTGYRGDEI